LFLLRWENAGRKNKVDKSAIISFMDEEVSGTIRKKKCHLMRMGEQISFPLWTLFLIQVATEKPFNVDLQRVFPRIEFEDPYQTYLL
jgi:hypothetical protein